MSKIYLEQLGRILWTRIRDGESLSIRQGEVALTDFLLLEIRRASLPSVDVQKIGPSEEPRNGADFDLWVASDGRYRRLLVQAKRLWRDHRSYRTLGHRVRNVRQLDLLLHASNARDALPAYALYNYCPGVKPKGTWHCCESEEADLFGWTIAPAERVADALAGHGCRTFGFLHQDPRTKPARCLLCPEWNKGGTVPDLSRFPSSKGTPTVGWNEEVGWHDELPAALREAAEGPISLVDWREVARAEEFDDSVWPRYALVIRNV